VTYVIDLRSMECVVVWPTFQPPDSIDVPLLAMGSLVLMAENSASEGCTLRVFDATDIENSFSEVGTTMIPTQVRNPLLLRGNKLFVPAAGEQFSAFTVSDSKEQEPLLDIARPPSRSEYDGEVFLLGGPDGRLWTASDSLRKFQLTQDALPEDQEKRIFIGASGQPLQKIGETLFVGQRGMGSDAIRLVQVDGEAMTEYGKTIVGTGVLTVLPIGKDSLLCLTRTGELFQVNGQKLETGGFLFRPDGQLKIPVDVDEPLRACVLAENRIAVTCGGKTPQLWIVNQSGRVSREEPTSLPAVLAPVPLAGGAVVPQPATLQLLGLSGDRTVEEFLGTVEQQDTVQWASVVPVDSDHVLVTGQDGKITRVGFRGNPKPHLQRVESLDVGQKVHVAPVVRGNRVVISDATGRTQLLDAAGFRQQAETTLSSPAFGSLYIVGERLIVQTEDQKLHCLALDRKLEKVWSVEMGEDAVSGSPLMEDDSLILGTMNGRVMTLNFETGETRQTLQLDQPVEHGPYRVGSHLVVVTIDGSLYRVESSPGESS